jgi:hypothetical protein
MGDIIDLKTIITKNAKVEDTSAFEEFLVAEGLALLSAFRSIDDVAVRESILRMVVDAATRSRPDASG